MILVAGLTGGIGSGKSTVAGMLAARGCDVIDSDRIVADLYVENAAGWLALVEEYGDDILREDGTIDRVALSAIALSTPEGAARLNGLIHPLVIDRQRAWLDSLNDGRDRIAVIEATLLLESGGRDRCDVVIVVTAPIPLQVERAVARGLPEEEALRRIARQMRVEERVNLADYVIENSGTLEQLDEAVTRIHSRLLEELARRRQ